MATGLVCVLSLFPVGSVYAQTAPADSKAGATFDQRLEQRKLERKVQLADKDQKRLVTQCKAAQEVVRKLQRSTAQMVEKRAEAYQAIDAKLWIITGRLKLAQQDTFQLQKARAELETKTTSFTVAATNYQQALDDLVVMNCQADAVGFKALLETARLYYSQLRDQSAAIRDALVNTVKAALNDMTTQLQPQTNAEGTP